VQTNEVICRLLILKLAEAEHITALGLTFLSACFQQPHVPLQNWRVTFDDSWQKLPCDHSNPIGVGKK
jgi:hypothetical protein